MERKCETQLFRHKSECVCMLISNIKNIKITIPKHKEKFDADKLGVIVMQFVTYSSQIYIRLINISTNKKLEHFSRKIRSADVL